MTLPIAASEARHVPPRSADPVPGIMDGEGVRLLDTAPGDDWDALARSLPPTHLAHAAQWFTVIENAYGHRPLYLVGRERDGHATLLLPSFLLRRRLLGGVVTSMPFLDAGGPVGGSAGLVRAAVDRLLSEARTLHADRIELRSVAPLDLPVEASLEKVTLVRCLPSDPDTLWRGLDSKVRNQIRKAERSGITVEAGGSERLDEFYRVFAVNMRDLGSPVHAKRFFAQILERFGCAARVLIARKDALPVGGLIEIDCGHTRYVPWASTLRAYSALCPNMLMYWQTLRRACQEGIPRFDFGRSSRGSGTYRFKRQWGAEENQLYWYAIPVTGRRTTQVAGKSASWALMARLWRHLPMGVTLALGPRIRKYLSQ